MPKKSTASVDAIEVKPASVAERRRAIRDAKGEGASSGPGVKKVEIDLTKPGARKALTALYPRPTSDMYIDATPETEAAALQYVDLRDDAKVLTDKKEVAGNILCNAIRSAKGIRGNGWKAEWSMSKGSVDWTQLAKDLAIPDGVIEKYRKPESRGLDVREVAEEG